jgi:hypothetical protein
MNAFVSLEGDRSIPIHKDIDTVCCIVRDDEGRAMVNYRILPAESM